MAAGKNSLEHALEEAVSRALRDNLAPLQRTADELHHAYADLVAACASSRPSNALPSLLRAQASASALAAGLSVLSNFVALALNPREQTGAATATATAPAEDHDAAKSHSVKGRSSAVATEELDPPVAPQAEVEPEEPWVEEPADVPEARGEAHAHAVTESIDDPVEAVSEPEAVVEEAAPAAFNVADLSAELQDLHKRANRVAKVAMQDIQLLQPKEVRMGREHKDICVRLRSDIDKARKEYDRRFRAIQDHPVDYFHHWMVEILAGGDSQALGEYPYPSPVLRH